MASKFSRVVAQDVVSPPTKSRGHVTNKKRYISTFTSPMAPKLSRVVTLDEGTHIQSHAIL